jgi:hypothetical protein
MNREVAVAVLREILVSCRELIETNYLNLKPSDANIRKKYDDYELHIKLVLSDPVRQCIEPILEKHKLSVRESKDIVIIYSLN